MSTSYEVMEVAGESVFTSPRSAEDLAKVDAVVFDCDGTLIDVRESYDASIIRTAVAMSRECSGEAPPLEETGGKLILQIRRTGGFNSDWDVTYALSLFSALVIDGRGDARPLGFAEERLKEIVTDFTSEKRLAGWRSVDEYLRDSGLENAATREMRRYLGYPGTPFSSRLASTFDQVYYGEQLYRRVYGVPPRVAYRSGLIEKEKVMVTEDSLSRVAALAGEGRIAMATGRPHLAVEYTLGALLDYFDRDASVYIGDGDVSPELAAGLSKFRKPSCESLLLARDRFDSKVLLYVGDSAEDRLMAESASAAGARVLFAGIYGTSFDEEEQISYFTGTNSDMVVKDVNQIVGILEGARA